MPFVVPIDLYNMIFWCSDFCDPDLWPFPCTLLLSIVRIPGNSMMIRWDGHCEKDLTDWRTERRTNGRTEVFLVVCGPNLKRLQGIKRWCRVALYTNIFFKRYQNKKTCAAVYLRKLKKRFSCFDVDKELHLESVMTDSWPNFLYVMLSNDACPWYAPCYILKRTGTNDNGQFNLNVLEQMFISRWISSRDPE